MHLDMTMHQERPGVNHLIPQRQPRRPSERCRRDESIADLRRAQVEALRDVVHGLSHGRVIEEALSLADDKVLVGVLVDWMRWLDRRVNLMTMSTQVPLRVEMVRSVGIAVRLKSSGVVSS